MTERRQLTIDEANARIAKEADDKAARWHAVFAGTATAEQAKRVLSDLRGLCLADECPAHAAAFDVNRTMHMTGRQAIWREVSEILANNPTQR